MSQDEKQELWQRYRPKTLDDVVGQDLAVRTVRGFGAKIPHCLLLTGSSGTGKTTLARIIARTLGCPPENTFDYFELNCPGVESAIETIRGIGWSAAGRAMAARCRVWVLDESQSLGRFKYAQEALLKILEDTHAGSYFILVTTDPARIIKTVRNRCTHIPLVDIPAAGMKALLNRVARAEGIDVAAAVVDAIVANVGGSARQALVLLEKVAALPAEDRLAAVDRTGAEAAAFDLAKALLPWDGSAPSWAKVAPVLTQLKEQELDPEGVRMVVMATARTAILKGGKNAHDAARLVLLLDRDFYANPTLGNAVLAAALFKFCTKS